jgi:hypothetical protein
MENIGFDRIVCQKENNAEFHIPNRQYDTLSKTKSFSTLKYNFLIGKKKNRNVLHPEEMNP